MTIRSRLLLLVISALLPAVAAALWSVAQTYNADRRAQIRNLRDTTRALSLVVERELEQRAAIARVLSLSSVFDKAADLEPADLLQFEDQARRAMQGLQGWIELGSSTRLLLSTGMSSEAVGTTPPGAASVAGALFSAPGVLPLGPGPGGGLRAGMVQPVMYGGAPRMNLAVTILPSELQRIIDRQRLPADWVAAVLDNRQTLVARHPGGIRYAGRESTSDLRAHIAGGPEGLFEAQTLDGARVTGYFSTSPQGWTYVTAMPAVSFVGRVPRAAIETALAALLLIGLSVLGALWVARRIAGPVHSLLRSAEDMKAGRAVTDSPTGIVECDAVAHALADAAESIRNSRVDLERQVAEAVERTRAAEQRLSQSQRVEALGRLTGGVAHDFNNLLGVISNSAHLIDRHSPVLPDLKVPVSATLRAVEMGSRLTQHLVRFAGRQPVKPEALDLTSWLPDVQELLQTVLGKRIALAVAVAPGTRPITADPSELELALINLALNARDAMVASGQVWLRAGNASSEDSAGLAPGAYVMLTITDDGSGIDEALVQRVFEPFFTTKGVGKGTGLGLSQVHGFCVQAGGTARVASTPGLGTTVSLLLPARPDGPALPAAQPAVAEAVQPGIRVLLVEDNEALGDVTAALLDSLHCVVERASGAEDALRRLADGLQVDVVLSDVVMPGELDGHALARTLKARWPGLPVVLITGYSSARAAAAAEFTVLGKPCSPTLLMATLQQAIARAAAGQ